MRTFQGKSLYRTRPIACCQAMWRTIIKTAIRCVCKRGQRQTEMKHSHWLCTVAVALIIVACASWQVRAAVISIDFGGEWLKVALVKPGVPMEIVINKESKRKTAAIVSMRNDERLFGDAALSTGVKYPKSAYWYLQLLLGQKYDSPLVAKYREWFPYYDMKKDEERGTILFQHDSETFYSPEELVAMILNYTRIFAQDYAGQPIRDCVITIPVFFTQAQRRAMLYSANLVGLNVLQLMTDAAATALNYGLFRQASFNTTPQYIMFYDIGALSTTAAIIEYRMAQVKEGSVANTYPQLAVKGIGYDRLLGGLEIDIRLRDHLARGFESLKKTQGSVFDSPRAMGKLLKEAKRVKQVLSANIDHYAQVEGLLEDVDFRLKVTREELDEMCADLYDRVREPVKQALEAAEMTMIEMDSVILMGGSTRVPLFQEALLDAVNKPDLGRSLNTDEAAAMGAVYQAAGQTKLFRVKKFIVKDANVLPIMVSFEKHVKVSEDRREGGEEEAEETVKVVKKTLFQRSNSYPQKKVLTFNRYSDDFPFSVYYSHLSFLSEEEKSYVGRLNLTEVYLAGVGDALSTHSAAEAKGIKAHFRMDESGLLLLDNVESIFEYPPEEEEQSTFAKIGSTLSNLFGGGSSDADTMEEPSTEQMTGEGLEDGNTESDEQREEGEEGQKAGEREDGEEREGEEGEKGDDEESENEENDLEEGVDEEGEVEDVLEEEDEAPSTEEEPQSSLDDNEEEILPMDETPPTEETTPSTDEEIPSSDEGEHQQQEEDSESTAGSADSSSSESNATTSDTDTKSSKKEDKKTEKEPPTNRTVKVNLTAEINLLDLQPPSTAGLEISMTKLRTLQERDEEKVANEKAKNNLESYIFETRELLEVDDIIAVSSEEQREEIRVVVGEVSDWFEEEGYYSAETSVYKEKLRELKKSCRSIRKRAEEAEKRPELINRLQWSINASLDFVIKIKNLTDEMQIFTDVEINSLVTLVNESMEWLMTSLVELEATPPHVDPPVLSHQFEDQQRKLDREMMYLINKIKMQPPPKPKTPNSTNTTTTNTEKPQNDTKDTVSDEGPESEAAGEEKGGGTEEDEEPERLELPPADAEEEDEEIPEPLELPPAEDIPTEDASEDASDLPTSATRGTPRGEL